MNPQRELLLACTFHGVSVPEFVAYWERGYFSKPDDDKDYDDNIESWVVPGNCRAKEQLSVLFKWKNGINLSGQKQRSVEAIWDKIEKRGGVQVVKEMDPEALLCELAKHHGIIWSIFLLHCLHPSEYPIFDRHAYRAMTFIQGEEKDLSTLKDKVKICSYLGQYRTFWNGLRCRLSLQGVRELRRVDRALWAFGRFLSENYAFMVK